MSEARLSAGSVETGELDGLREVALARHGHDWAGAVGAWAAVRARFPDEVDGWAWGIVAACEAGEREAAEVLAGEALGRLGEHWRIVTERATVTFYTRDWPEARRRFARLRELFPDFPLGYVRGMEVAENLGDHGEGAEMIGQAFRRFPRDEWVLGRTADWAERHAVPGMAAAAWRRLREMRGEADAFLGEARALADAGDPDAAEAVLIEGLRRHAGHEGFAPELARTATRAGRWAEAARRWEALATEPAHAAEARSRVADAERFAAPAVPVAADAIAGLPMRDLAERRWLLRYGRGQVMGQNIRLLPGGAIGNHAGEARSWALERGRLRLHDASGFPMVTFTTVATDDDGRWVLSGRDCVHPLEASVLVLEEQRPPMSAVMSEFESLGDNCEFGLVQRFFGAEPLGLLRFNWTTHESLLAGLADRFAAVDAPDAVRISRAGNGELIGHVDALGFFYHTYRYTAELDLERFARSEATRLRFLADLLFDVVADGEKIFVRRGETVAEEDRIRALHAALREIGPATLLWVAEADGENAAGSVVELAPGLLRGHVEALAPYDGAARARFESWGEVCTRAHRMVRPERWQG